MRYLLIIGLLLLAGCGESRPDYGMRMYMEGYRAGKASPDVVEGFVYGDSLLLSCSTAFFCVPMDSVAHFRVEGRRLVKFVVDGEERVLP